MHLTKHAQNQSIPIYTLNQTNINDTLPLLSQPDWVKDWVKGAVNAGYVVIIPEGWVNVNQWYGTGWAQIEPSTGLGAYIIAGGLSQEVREQVISFGGSGTVPMIISWLREFFVVSSVNMTEALESGNVTKAEAAAEVIATTLDLREHLQLARIVVGADIGLALIFLTTRIVPPPHIIGAFAGANVVVFTLLYLDVRTIIEKGKIARDPEGEILW